MIIGLSMHLTSSMISKPIIFLKKLSIYQSILLEFSFIILDIRTTILKACIESRYYDLKTSSKPSSSFGLDVGRANSLNLM